MHSLCIYEALRQLNKYLMAAYFVQGRVAGVICNSSIREGGFPIYGKMQIILVSMDRYI